MIVFSRDRHSLSLIAGVPCRTVAVLTMLATLFAVNGSSYGQAAGSEQAAASETVIAKVDDVAIDGREYELARQTFMHDLKGLDEKARHDFLVQYLIDVAIMSKEAQKEDLTIDEAALQRNFEFLRKRALMERWLGSIAQSAMTDEAVRKAYDQAVKDAASEPEIRMRVMRFKVDDAKDDKAVKAAEARANEAIARVKKGKEFAKVAEDMTGTSMPATLVEASYMNRQQMKREVAQVVFGIEVGGISAPIRTEQGWEVIKIEDKRAIKPPEFELVREKFAVLVGRKAQLTAMEKLRSETKIERTESAQQPQDQVTKTPK